MTEATDPQDPHDAPAAPAAPAPRAARRLRLSALRARHKFALLGVLGMLMVATPLTEVVRRQGQELQMLLGARAGLEPLARAVDVQRALLAHRGPAAQVLSGHGEMEPERRARQDDVDRRLAALSSTLEGGHYAPALDEDAGLRDDWLALVARITERRISAAGSDAAHRLLVEQVLQVMDLVSEAPGGGSGAVVAGRPPAAVVALAAARRGARADDEAAARRQLQSAASAIAALDAELADAAAGVRRSGFALWGLLGLLAVLEGLLADSLWRQLGSRAGAAGRDDGAGEATTGRDGPESRQPAEHLLRRLRSAGRSVGDPREEAPPSRL